MFQELVLELLKDAMLRYPDSPGFLLDGFPREMSQAEKFEEEVCNSSPYLQILQ